MDALLEVQEAAIDQLQGMQFDLTASSASTNNQGLPSACLPCRRMALELSSAAENLLTENHDAALALEATTLALAELELHSRIIDRKARLNLNTNQVDAVSSIPPHDGSNDKVKTTGQLSLRDMNLCIEFLPSIISFQEQTTKLLKTIQDAQEAYAKSEEFEYHEPGPKVLKATNDDQTSSTKSDWGCAVSCAQLRPRLQHVVLPSRSAAGLHGRFECRAAHVRSGQSLSDQISCSPSSRRHSIPLRQARCTDVSKCRRDTPRTSKCRSGYACPLPKCGESGIRPNISTQRILLIRFSSSFCDAHLYEYI